VNGADIKGRLFLLDGSSLAYRAFFALPETIATRAGFPTNGLYGFSQMLVKLVSEYRPGGVVVAWDASEKTFRHEDYAEYKADRPSMPDLLSEQWPHFRELVEAFGMINLERAGFEADDILATLVVMAGEQGIQTCVVTGDRDALQLVSGDVAVMTTGRGVTDVKVYDQDAVVARYGISPEQVPDFIGLKGDSSDNIPGISGVGEKTAAQLLQQFGTLESIYAHLDEIKSEKRRALLRENEQIARLSKQLATAHTEVPVECDVAGLMAGEPYCVPVDSIEALFREWEFGSLIRRVRELYAEMGSVGAAGVAAGAGEEAGGEAAGAGADAAPSCAPLPAPAVRQPQVLEPFPEVAPEHAAGALAALLEQREAGIAVVRVEDEFEAAPGSAALAMPIDADGAVTAPPEPRFALAVYDGGPRVLTAVAEEPVLRGLWRAAPHMLGHDVKAMPGAAEAVAGPGADTMVGAYLLAPERPEGDLRKLAEVDEGWLLPAAGEAGAQDDGAGGDVAARTARAEAATRAFLAQRVAARQEPLLDELGLGRLYRETELPLVRVLARMEAAGVRIDPDRLGQITARLRETVGELEERIYNLAGGQFTLGSPRQLAEVLFSRLGLAPVRKGKTGYSTDAKVLATLRDQHPIIPAIEEWRELTKLISTYLIALPPRIDPRSGRLHTTFNQTVAATGRLSSTNPNLQNIPIRSEIGAEIRGCFIAGDGAELVVADYSQIELRLMAHFAEEPALLEAFRRGEDVHAATAAAVGGIPLADVTREQRERAKATNFGIMYGLSAFGLSEQVGMTMEEARDFIAAYFARYPRVRAFRDRVIVQATEDGFVTTILGRRRAIPELRSPDQRIRSLGERLAVNTVLQGSAADIIKAAMIRADAELERDNLTARLVLQVHDELVFEAPHAEAAAVEEIARRTMCGAYRMDPPLEIHVGSGANWRDAK